MSKPYLSADELQLALNCCDQELGRLERLHWDGVSFNAGDPLYRNLADRRHKIELVKSKVAAIFEAQFPIS